MEVRVAETENPALGAVWERLDAIVAELAALQFEETPPLIQLFFAKFYAAMELLGPTPCQAPIDGHQPREARAVDGELLAAVQEVVALGEFALSECRP